MPHQSLDHQIAGNIRLRVVAKHAVQTWNASAAISASLPYALVDHNAGEGAPIRVYAQAAALPPALALSLKGPQHLSISNPQQ